MLIFTENRRRNTGLAVTTNPRVVMSVLGTGEASQAEAEAGSILGKYMSPLRVAQALDGGQLSAVLTSVLPASNDGGALGASGTAWSDLFLASGGIINWNAGDVTITHGSNTLAFAGATSGYSFDNSVFVTGLIAPLSNDSAALGTSSLSWADLFLASGAVINFANSDYTLTHSTGLLTTSGPIAFGGGSTGAAPSARITLGSYHDDAGAVSISHVALYGTSYGFGISTGTLAYISASGGVHRFFTGADLTSTNWSVEAGPYNTASSTTATGALRVQGGVGVTGAIHAGANSGATPQIVSYGRMLIKGNSGDASAVLELTNNAGNTSYIYSNSSGQLQFTPYADVTIFAGDFYAGGLFNIGEHLQRQVPVTETGTTHTVAVTTSYLICNNSGTVTVTLPAAGSFPGRELYIKNIDGTATVVSASSNVVPRVGGSAGTAILAAADGAWALLVSDLTNWIVVAGS